MSKHTKSVLSLEQTDSEVTMQQQLQWERELLGLYLSQHPLEEFKTILEEQTVPLTEIKSEHHNKTVKIGGSVLTSNVITTKNGQAMAFVQLADANGEMEIVVFPSVHQQTLGIWERDNVLIIDGKVSSKDKTGEDTGEVKILAGEARQITEKQAKAYQPTGKKKRVPKPQKVRFKPTEAKRLYLRVQDSTDQDKLKTIKSIIDDNPGDTEVVLVVGDEKQKQAIKIPKKLKDNDETKQSFTKLMGEANIK